jgi:hypothetical protein
VILFSILSVSCDIVRNTILQHNFIITVTLVQCRNFRIVRTISHYRNKDIITHASLSVKTKSDIMFEYILIPHQSLFTVIKDWKPREVIKGL